MFDIDVNISVWLLTILSTLVVGVTGAIPALIIPQDIINRLSSQDGRNKLNYFLSFAVGSILGDVFLHLLPETWELYKSNPEIGGTQNIGIIIIIGIVLFLFIEKMFSENGETKPSEPKEENQKNDMEDHSEFSNHVRRRNHVETSNNEKEVIEQRKPPVKIQGYLNLLANIVDNFVHGLAVGGSYTVSPTVGAITTICILIHELPHEVGDFVILLRSGFDRGGAIRAQLYTASSSLFGAVAALIFDSATAGLSKAYILPFSCGGFLYVALVTLVPDLTKEEDEKESIKQIFLILAGLAVTSYLALANI